MPNAFFECRNVRIPRIGGARFFDLIPRLFELAGFDVLVGCQQVLLCHRLISQGVRHVYR